jgi:hypothetical protein
LGFGENKVNKATPAQRRFSTDILPRVLELKLGMALIHVDRLHRGPTMGD